MSATSDPLQRKMYHTQEARGYYLTEPLICERRDAWLGVGYYYWDDSEDAIRWGNDSKRRTNKFDVYESVIECDNVLNTVFNEEHYNFWLTQIEKVARHWYKKTGYKLNPARLNERLREKSMWSAFDGILFQDLPQAADYLLVVDFFYRKRLQLVVFNKKIVLTFVHYLQQECTQPGLTP